VVKGQLLSGEFIYLFIYLGTSYVSSRNWGKLPPSLINGCWLLGRGRVMTVRWLWKLNWMRIQKDGRLWLLGLGWFGSTKSPHLWLKSKEKEDPIVLNSPFCGLLISLQNSFLCWFKVALVFFLLYFNLIKFMLARLIWVFFRVSSPHFNKIKKSNNEHRRRRLHFHTHEKRLKTAKQSKLYI